VRSVGLLLTWIFLLHGRSVGQGNPDTTITTHGFLEPADTGGWQLLLAEPVTAAGHRTYLVAALGNAAHWTGLADRYVEVKGRLQAVAGPSQGAAISVDRVREIEPPGTNRITVQYSFDQHAIVTLAVIPERFAWRLPSGEPSGVQPVLMYTVFNHGQSDLDYHLTTNDAVCADVRHEGEQQRWRTSLSAPTANKNHIVIRLGGLFRQFVVIAPEAAPEPGVYVGHVTLCGLLDYALETRFEVRAP
jgi:hypothetical protein